MSGDDFMTTEEVAKYLRIHYRTVTNMAERGDIPASKVGNRWRFRRRDVEAYLEKRKPKPRD